MRDSDKRKKKGIIRLVFAFRNSINGLRFAFNNETAFRQEVFLYILSLPAIFLIPVMPSLKGLLFFSNTLVLVVESINSAIESVVDLSSPDYHHLAKQAKDMGSAAVLLSLLLCLALWGYAILSIIG